MELEEYRRATRKTPRKKRKWGNSVLVVDGIKFHSQKEVTRYRGLKLLQRNGSITDLVAQGPKIILQPRFKLAGKTIRAITYTPDFSYIENGIQIIEDVKAVNKKTGVVIQTPKFRDKWKRLLFNHREEIEAGTIEFRIYF
jgi:hypothetical protein